MGLIDTTFPVCDRDTPPVCKEGDMDVELKGMEAVAAISRQWRMTTEREITERLVRLAIGDGLSACERGVWPDVWGTYARLREAVGLPAALPLGIDDHLGRLRMPDTGWSVNFVHLHRQVFSRLCREPLASLRSGAAVVEPDRLMRGALRGYVWQLQSDTGKMRRLRDDEQDAEKRAARAAVLADMIAERERWRLTLNACFADNWIVTAEGRRIALHLDTDLNGDGHAVTTATLGADCPACGQTTGTKLDIDTDSPEYSKVSCVNCNTTWDVQGRV